MDTEMEPNSSLSSSPHSSVKSKKPLISCPFEDCPKMFMSQSDLKRHLRVHTGEKPFVCPVCNKAFSQKGTLNRHKALHDSKVFKCSYGCGKTFTTSVNCKQHERIHRNERPYVCTYPGCSNAYPSAASLNYHIKTHLGVRNYVCSCGKRFLTSSNLNKHQKTHCHFKQYICPLCSQECAHPTELNKHFAESHKTYQIPVVNIYPPSISTTIVPSLSTQNDIIIKYQSEIDRLKFENHKIINDNRQLAVAYQQLNDLRMKSDIFSMGPYTLLPPQTIPTVIPSPAPPSAPSISNPVPMAPYIDTQDKNYINQINL